ncbi:MAG: phosphatase [Gemmiger sp.]
MMNKTTFGAALAFLFAAAGALTAAALYLRRREKELDEYESLLFGEDPEDEEEAEEAEEAEETIYEPIPEEPAAAPAPAEEEAAEE